MFSSANMCLSGGADGADLAWGRSALQHGHEVVHFIFEGHRSKAPKNLLRILDDEELSVADPYLAEANKRVKRRWPSSNRFVSNLLRRNYYQVRWANAAYAVSSFEDGFVAGGTAWAVAMFLDRFSDGEPQPCYVFDQENAVWTQWDGEGFLIIDRPPPPSGIWAGIGSREMKRSGHQAIDEVWSTIMK